MIQERQVVIQSTAYRQGWTPGIEMCNIRVGIRAANICRASKGVDEWRDPFRGRIAENRPSREGVETIVISIWVSAKFELAAEITIEVVGHAAERTVVHR